jgi:hypothetical protein
MKAIPDTHHDLLSDEKRVFLYLGTTMADGGAQVSPVWFNTDDEHILVNSARGRLKDLNMRTRPIVGMTIADPENPYRYILVRGPVVEITEDGADEHINALSKKYTGRETFTYNDPEERRVIYRIKPEKVATSGK